MSAEALNILVTLDCNYLYQLNVMLTSLLEREEGCVRVFLLSRGEMTDEQLANTRLVLAGRSSCRAPPPPTATPWRSTTAFLRPSICRRSWTGCSI